MTIRQTDSGTTGSSSSAATYRSCCPCRTPAPSCPATSGPPRLSLARAQGHRPLRRPALFVCRRPGRYRDPHPRVADHDRREPRSRGPLALPRPGDHRALPDDDVRRRAALPRRRRARCTGDRRATRAVLRALSLGDRRRGRTAPQEARQGGALRRALDPLGGARLFEGTLPVFNLGTNSGQSCAPELAQALEEVCAASGLPTVVNGRFKGGYITRHYGQPDGGVHAVQLELAMRSYLDEPAGDLREDNWPPAYDAARAATLIATLQRLIAQCMSFVRPARRRRARTRP